jgi:hypothetical protein
MTITHPGYYNFCNEKPKAVHIGWYPNIATKANLLRYLMQTGLSGRHSNHESVSVHSMHVTLLNHGSVILPVSYDKITPISQAFSPPFPVKVMGTTNVFRKYPIHTIAIILEHESIKRYSDKLHAKFKLKPNNSTFIYHMAISNTQLGGKSKFKTLRDYQNLPPFDYPLVFDSEEVSSTL